MCEWEYYEEEVDASNQLVQFESEQDMIDSFLRDYGTVGNYQRVFGGSVEFPEPQADERGHLSVGFSRPVVFPDELMRDFDSNYVRKLPVLYPT